MDLAFIFKTFRSRGYTLEHSIAELADNSKLIMQKIFGHTCIGAMMQVKILS